MMNIIRLTKRWFKDVQTCGFCFIDTDKVEAFPKLPKGSYPGMNDEPPRSAILDEPHALVDHANEAHLAEVGQETIFIDSETGNTLGSAIVAGIQYFPYWKSYAIKFVAIQEGETS